MQAPRLTPWIQHSHREWRRSVIADFGHTVAIVRVWGRNKRGVAEWQWATLYPGFQALPTEFRTQKPVPLPSRVSEIFTRKVDAMCQIDDLFRNAGVLLLKDKHLAFI